MTEIEPISEELIFLTAIEKNPDDQSKKLLYADWLDEQGRGSDGDAMRWLVAKSKFPKRHVNYHWDLPFFGEEIQSSSSALPKPILKAIDYNNWLYGYTTLRDCLSWFFIGFALAQEKPSWFWRLFGYKAWVPDYTPIKSEEEELLGYYPLGLETCKDEIQIRYGGHQYDENRRCSKCGLTEKMILNRKLS